MEDALWQHEHWDSVSCSLELTRRDLALPVGTYLAMASDGLI